VSLAAPGGTIFGTLILPVYEAAGFLATTLVEVRAWLEAHPEPWELLIVDDGSRDATPVLLDAFARQHAREAIRVIRFTTNRGKGFAIRVGLDRARGRYAVFTDCDLAYPMPNVALIVDRLESGADVAIANRVAPESTYLIRPDFFSYLFTRHVMGRIFNWICRVVAVPRILDTQAGLKGFKTEAVQPVLSRLRLDGFSFDVELLRALIDRGARIEEVPVAFRYDSEPSTVHFTLDALRMARDLVRVRWRSYRDRYRVIPEPRHLIIHADDFGLAPGVNAAIEGGLLSGALTSASILLGGEAAGEALAWAAAHPEFDFGVHLNVTQGRPVLPPERVPSLVDGTGRFRSLPSFLVRGGLRRVSVAEIEAEWRAQIALVREAGVHVSHLDSHQHVHLIPEIFRRLAVRLAKEEGLSLRTMDGPVVIRGPRPDVKGLALSLATKLGVGRRFRHVVHSHGAGTALRDAATLEGLKAVLRSTRPGESYELVVHPGIVDEGLKASGDGYGDGREAERALLEAEETRAWLRLAGFRLGDFRTKPPDA
jgi:predicted glycoside hydrolase/deacetylase ChbG (UPF0249 family)